MEQIDDLTNELLTVPILHLSYPFPELRTNKDINSIVSVKSETLTNKLGKTSTVTLYTDKGHEITLRQPQHKLTEIANFLSDSVAEKVQTTGPYCFAHEMPDGRLFLQATPRGVDEMKLSGKCSFLMDGCDKRLSVALTNDHPIILPPFIHFKGDVKKCWYFADGSKVGIRHFTDRLIAEKWVILNRIEL